MAENKQKTAYERLKEYEKNGAHMLIPSAISIEDIAAGFALIVEPVFLKPHPRDKYVYPHTSQQYDYQADDWKPEFRTGNEQVRIHKQGFDRLAQAAKIDWLPPQLVRDPNVAGRMMVSIEGMIRTSTGELYRVADVYGMDLEIEKKKLEMQYSKSQAKDYLIKRDLLQKEAHQEKMCVSGAKNRVTKQLLCIANTYTVADLAKPFVAVRIVPHLDMNDEYTRKRVVDVQIAAMAGIYGLLPSAHPEQKAIEMVAPVPEGACLTDDNVIDTTTTDAGNGGDEPAKTYRLDAPPLAMDDIPDPTANLRADFENCDVDGQCKTLVILAGKKGFAVNAWLQKFNPPTTLQKLTPAKRIEVYDYLCGLQDPAEKGGTAK